MLNELKKLFSTSFSSISSQKENVELVLMTHDAHIVHRIDSEANDSEAALVSGLWEASHQLTHNKGSILDFSSSSTNGFFVGCLDEAGKYLVYSKYSKQTNPAHLKFMFKKSIHDFKEGSLRFVPSVNTEFLFEEISDDEIDQMFQDLGV